MSGANDYCLGFGTSGEPIYVWDHPDATAEQRLSRVLAILDFAQKNKIDVYLGEWSPPRGLGITSPDDPRWPRIIADFVQYLVAKKHYSVVGHYIFFNEPNGVWMWPHSAPDYSAWSKGIRRLRQELDRRDLKNVLLAGPDNSGDKDWFAASVHDLAPQFGAWESHIYATDAEVYGGLIESSLTQATATVLSGDPNGTSKVRFIAESGLQDGKDEATDQQPRVRTFPYGVIMADYVSQVARAGWMGANAWDLDDAMHGNRQRGPKVWGFWDSSPSSDMANRPWFYTWSLISRYFPRGSSIRKVNVSPSADRFRATAATWASAKGGEVSILLVNDDDIARTVIVDQLPRGSGKLYCYHYFDSDRPVAATGLPKPADVLMPTRFTKGLTISMPSRGVVLLTTAGQ
jgi:hypothetical protein